MPRFEHNSARTFSNILFCKKKGVFLDKLLIYGWNYFYRVIIFYLKKLESLILKQNDEADLLMVLKSLVAKRNKDNPVTVQWEQLLEEALFFRIDDSLIDKLVDKKGYFKPCPIKANQNSLNDKKTAIK